MSNVKRYVSFRKKQIFAVLAASSTPLTVCVIAHQLKQWRHNYVPTSAMRHINAMLWYYVKVGYVEQCVDRHSVVSYKLTAYGAVIAEHYRCDTKV